MAQKMDRTQMKEVPAANTVEPFGKVNYWDVPDGSGRMIRATILMDVRIEGAKVGMAIDGSGSMESLFGKNRYRLLFRLRPMMLSPRRRQ